LKNTGYTVTANHATAPPSLWDGLQMIQESSADKRQSLYLYTDEGSYEPLARIDTDGNQEQHIRYFHTDLNGCPEELTDANGKILWECSFQLWGKRIHEIEHEPIEQNLRYQGQYLDRETGLHYNTFRYYDPDIGRFTQPDPIGLLGGLNLYQYAPNGLTWVDPWGLMKCGLTGKEVGNATNLPIIKRGSPEWKKAIEIIQRGGKSNFRVKDKAIAEQLLKDARGKIEIQPTYSEIPYKKGYEHHPNESHTINAPENNIPHIKWKDWSLGKKSGGAGHIFYE
ncbi:RHS repeat domain-containing protein, partial [Snodgrassella alvi]|uniref:RHS repeat domain-containing protein n=1 Tax=Snodgrassella alvi TaxID=1196083 RepID=UPI001555A414